MEEELQRLSLIAFSILNRRRQWVTEAELDADLAALLVGPPHVDAADASGNCDRPVLLCAAWGGIIEGSRMQTFEFLHATFGEYLAAD